ncbi:MAG: putative HTH-type transcriptional regulator YegW [Lentisphaerae bacterium ADurb.Bin242]|nr:MAG: putative HTH-type transcriptional regulator YegW [Lentisphaerae bacterium ADurb.Bin242]
MNLPKYSQVQYGVLNLIAERKLEAGDRIPVEKDLASLFGVSVVTVRSAMKNLEDRGIVTRQQGRGTVLNKVIEPQSQLGIILYLDIRESLDGPVLRNTQIDLAQLELSVADSGYAIRYQVARRVPTHFLLHSLRDVSGVLISGYITEEWLQLLEGLDIPIVLVGSIYSEQIPRFAHVDIDWKSMTRAALDFFVSLGLRKIGMVTGAGFYEPTRRLVAAYREGMAAHKLPYVETMICVPENNNARIPIRNFLKTHEDLDVILVEYGKYIYLLGELLDLERKPPFMGIIGLFRQLEELPARVMNVVPDRDIWHASVQMLIQQMTNPSARKERILLGNIFVNDPSVKNEILTKKGVRK